jgi:hypothetical protein
VKYTHTYLIKSYLAIFNKAIFRVLHLRSHPSYPNNPIYNNPTDSEKKDLNKENRSHAQDQNRGQVSKLWTFPPACM